MKKYICSHLTTVNLSILIALFTGIRLGELCALKWNDIDLVNNIIKVTKTLQRINITDDYAKTKIIIDTPKSPKSIRDIPIPDCLLGLLKKVKQNENCYILTSSVQYMEPRTLERNYKCLLEKIGIKYKKFHTLRHTFATTANMRGMDTKTLSAILGHENESFTLKMYVHISLEHKRNKMNSIYSNEIIVS